MSKLFAIIRREFVERVRTKAFLIGTIMGLSTLALNSELIAMRAAGVSVARIVVATMKIGLGFVLVAFLAGEYLRSVTQVFRVVMPMLMFAAMLTVIGGIVRRLRAIVRGVGMPPSRAGVPRA